MDVPNELLDHLSEEGVAVVSELGEVFAIFISMVMTVVGGVFAMGLPDDTKCPKCPFMRGSGMKNHTIGFYKCETQRDFLESMWSPYITALFLLMSGMLAGCSMVVRQIASPVVVRLVKYTFTAAISCLLWYVAEFQHHFEPVAKLSAYAKAAFTVYTAILPLVVVVGFRPTGTARKLVKVSVMCVGTALMFHLGLSGYNLFCGRTTRPLSAFFAGYFFIVSKLAILQEVPSHVSLAMCLLAIPPICPMIVLLLCWCFDVFWTDLSELAPAPRQPVPQPQHPMADTIRNYHPRFRNGYRLPSAFPFRSFR